MPSKFTVQYFIYFSFSYNFSITTTHWWGQRYLLIRLQVTYDNLPVYFFSFKAKDWSSFSCSVFLSFFLGGRGVVFLWTRECQYSKYIDRYFSLNALRNIWLILSESVQFKLTIPSQGPKFSTQYNTSRVFSMVRELNHCTLSSVQNTATSATDHHLLCSSIYNNLWLKLLPTRKHSSRMRTAHLPAVHTSYWISLSMTCWGCVVLVQWGGVLGGSWGCSAEAQ